MKDWELTERDLLIIRAECRGTTNVIEFAREVSEKTAQAAQKKLVEYLNGICYEHYLFPLQRLHCSLCWQAICEGVGLRR